MQTTIIRTAIGTIIRIKLKEESSMGVGLLVNVGVGVDVTLGVGDGVTVAMGVGVGVLAGKTVNPVCQSLG